MAISATSASACSCNVDGGLTVGGHSVTRAGHTQSDSRRETVQRIVSATHQRHRVSRERKHINSCIRHPLIDPTQCEAVGFHDVDLPAEAVPVRHEPRKIALPYAERSITAREEHPLTIQKCALRAVFAFPVLFSIDYQSQINRETGSLENLPDCRPIH